MKLLNLVTVFAFVLIQLNVCAQTNFESSDFSKTIHRARAKIAITDVNLLMGDVDGNGILSVEDVNELKKALLQSDYILANADAADFNGNGQIDISDVTLLIDELNHPSKGLCNGFEYVDLGLSVKWATCNVGASEPLDYGDYFTWGDTEQMSNYLWYYYKYNTSGYADSDGCNKYQLDDGKTTGVWYSNNSFIGDGKSTLEQTDDAATVLWGEGWRIPTPEEMSELLTKCKWTWINDGIKNGYKVERNGRYIFLPMAGCRYSTAYYGTNLYGYYWTNSLLDSYTIYAQSLYLNENSHKLGFDERSYGLTIRPVCP